MSEIDPPAAWLELPGGARHALAEICGLGRSRSNHIVPNGDGVSREHASIQRQRAGEYWLIDLRSKNGTILNGRRIFFPVKLQPGDVIEIGGQKFVFQRSAAALLDGGLSSDMPPTFVNVLTEPCWLLMADIANAVQLSRSKGPGEWSALLSRWLDACREAIEAAGGRIDKHVGDGFLAFWRVRSSRPEKIAEASGKLRALQKSAEAFFRIVLHCGDVEFGAPIAPGEEITPCPSVDFTFRLEELAGSLGLEFCLSAPAQALIGGHLLHEAVPGRHQMRGIDNLHDIFRVI